MYGYIWTYDMRRTTVETPVSHIYCGWGGGGESGIRHWPSTFRHAKEIKGPLRQSG